MIESKSNYLKICGTRNVRHNSGNRNSSNSDESDHGDFDTYDRFTRGTITVKDSDIPNNSHGVNEIGICLVSV